MRTVNFSIVVSATRQNELKRRLGLKNKCLSHMIKSGNIRLKLLFYDWPSRLHPLATNTFRITFLGLCAFNYCYCIHLGAL
jgi:hypothetical protein